MILHEFPEGVFTYVLLLKSGLGSRRALCLAIFGAGLTTPLGVLVSFPIVSWIEPTTVASLLAISAGALIYVGATHLLQFAFTIHFTLSFRHSPSGWLHISPLVKQDTGKRREMNRRT